MSWSTSKRNKVLGNERTEWVKNTGKVGPGTGKNTCGLEGLREGGKVNIGNLSRDTVKLFQKLTTSFQKA